MREINITLRTMDDWYDFVVDNGPSILDEYGTSKNAYQHAIQGGLTLGGGAAPLVIVTFQD